MAVTAVILLCTLPLAVKRSWGRYCAFARRLIVFMAILLLFGALGQLVLMLSAYGRWYVSLDAVMGDFAPFSPFGLTTPDFGPLGNARLLEKYSPLEASAILASYRPACVGAYSRDLSPADGSPVAISPAWGADLSRRE